MKFYLRSKLATSALTALVMIGSSTSIFAADKKPATSAVEKKPAAAIVVKLEAKEVDGKKIWSPATSSAKVGEAITVEAHNTLTAPHGLKIDGFVPETVIGAGETKSFTFTPTKKGDLKVHCQLHPAHVDATISVK